MRKHAALITVTDKHKETLFRQLEVVLGESAFTAAARLIEEQIRADRDIDMDEGETLIIAITPAEPAQEPDPGVCFAGSWTPEGDHSKCTHSGKETNALDTSSDSPSAEERS